MLKSFTIEIGKAETLKYIFVFDISSFRFQRLGVSAFAFKLSRLFALFAEDICRASDSSRRTRLDD
jgi:hypothetical protein